ncbi:MAG: amino acid ABC transporter ATP-binding protein [Verrucomicrobiaceae bacterium]|nr:MAG: amino acid ABC transporter ATP-binding protein [Verrucomicrobiaceae bacterium]
MRIGLVNVTKAFGANRVLDGVSFEAEFGHTLALVGPSGGGKSTLLRLLAGLDRPDSGGIFVDGSELPKSEESLRLYRRKIGIVFQAYNLFPHLSARDNVMLPLLQVHGLSKTAAADRAEEVLLRFQLSAHADKQPGLLSGGQRQRVAIARALAINPKFLLLDEPTSALDPEMTAEVLDVIAELRESGRPIILVTHEMGFARKSADLVAFVADGGICECRPAEEFFGNPASPATRKFLEKILKY